MEQGGGKEAKEWKKNNTERKQEECNKILDGYNKENQLMTQEVAKLKEWMKQRELKAEKNVG